MKLKKYEGNPILSPNPENYWESLVVCNPGVIYDNGVFHMLYRAAGNDIEHLVYIGKAESTDGIHFKRVSKEPVFSPGKDSFDAGSNEDPRIVKMGSEFFVTYAFRPYFASQYWKNDYDQVEAPEHDPNAPKCLRENISNTALAVSRDMLHFKKVGRLTEPSLDDRDVILFPEKINGKYWMLHRPKDYVNANGNYGTDYPSIWIKSSDDLMMWNTESKLLMKGEEDWEVKIGGNTPPIKTDDGWFLLYHGVDANFTYRVGAALLDLNDPTRVLYRTKDFILASENWQEVVIDLEEYIGSTFKQFYFSPNEKFGTDNVAVAETTYLDNIYISDVATSSGIADNVVSTSKVWGGKGALYVEGEAGEMSVYSVSGMEIGKYALNGFLQIDIERGIYLVKIGDTTSKIVVY